MKNSIKDIKLLEEEVSYSLKTSTLCNLNFDLSRFVYIETYGCQMNFSDTEIVASILKKKGFSITSKIDNADIIFLNTCSIREKAEQTVYNRLGYIKSLKKKKKRVLIGILGCMAERLKEKLLDEEKLVDLVVGPDAYRHIPQLIKQVDEGHKAVNTLLSQEETYADITPVRLHSNGVTAFISIMRGCDNMCSFCIVPFTRGRERSRSPYSIVDEATNLFEQGYREVTLLGQNVDSYKWATDENSKKAIHRKGINNVITFDMLLEMVACINPDLRIRFSTSNPRDITDQVLYSMLRHKNICKQIHLPVQSGNNRILKLMNRGYTREWYIEKIKRIRSILGLEVGLSSDIITGFCSETLEEHQDTLSLMDNIKYDSAYMFAYSERLNTPASKKMNDNIPNTVKKERLQEIIQKQGAISLQQNRLDIGKTFNVLIEGSSKRSVNQWQGRNSMGKVIVFPKNSEKKGDYVSVCVEKCTGITLLGTIVN